MGDRARSGLGEPSETREDMLKIMVRWKLTSLKKFIKTARSESWKNAAVWLLTQKEGIERQLKARQKIKQRRKNRGKAVNSESP